MVDLTSYESYECAVITLWVLILFEALVVWPVVILLIIHLVVGTSFFNFTGLTSLVVIDILNISLACSSDYALNFFRRLLLFSGLKYLGFFLTQWETLVYVEDTCPLFYVDIRGFSSLTEYFNHHLEKAKLCKDDGPVERARFKFAKKSRRDVLKRMPDTMKRLVENNRLEIRTNLCTNLTREHFRMLWNQESFYNDECGIFFIINECFQFAAFTGVSVMDEFWVNGKMVAFQTTCLMGEAMYDGVWAISPEARQLGLYFIGMRLVLKRAIADPSVKYVNLNTMPSENESLLLPKRRYFPLEIGQPNEDRNLVAVLFGIPDLVISFENLGKWVKALGSIRSGKEFWEVKDESDLC